MHLRKRDPQFATQDAMDEALEQGLFSTAAKVREEIDPFLRLGHYFILFFFSSFFFL